MARSKKKSSSYKGRAKKRSSHRRGGRGGGHRALYSYSRHDLLKELKRLRPRVNVKKYESYSREQLIGVVVMARRPHVTFDQRLQGMSRRELIEHIRGKRKGRGKSKRGAKKGGLFGGSKASSGGSTYFPSTRRNLQESRWAAEAEEAKEAEKYNDPSGRRGKKGGKKGKKGGKKGKKTAWTRFISANAHKKEFRYRNGKLNLGKMGVAYRRTKAGKKTAKKPAKKPAKRTAKKRSSRRDYGWY